MCFTAGHLLTTFTCAKVDVSLILLHKFNSKLGVQLPNKPTILSYSYLFNVQISQHGVVQVHFSRDFMKKPFADLQQQPQPSDLCPLDMILPSLQGFPNL